MIRSLFCSFLVVFSLTIIPSNAQANPREIGKRIWGYLAATYIGGKVSGVIDGVEDKLVETYESAEKKITEWYIKPYTDNNKGYCSDCGVTYYETHSCIYLDTYVSESYGGPTYYDNYDGKQW